MALILVRTLNFIALALIIFLCNSIDISLATRKLLPDHFAHPSTIQVGINVDPSVLKPSFPTPEITQTPALDLPSLQTSSPPPAPVAPVSPLPLFVNPFAPPAAPVAAHFSPLPFPPFPFPRLLPLPRFPPFPFIPTVPTTAPSLPNFPFTNPDPTVPSNFVASSSEQEETGP